MSMKVVKRKSFKLKKEAADWAKDQKNKLGTGTKAKWETNRTNNPEKPWEGRLFKDIK